MSLPSSFGPMPDMQKFGRQRIERVIGMTDEGEPASAPGTPSMRMIDPSGHVTYLPVRTCRNQKDADDPQRYQEQTLRRKLRQNWLHFDEPPPGVSKSEWVGKPCTEECPRNPSGLLTCAGHGKRGDEIRKRREVAAKRSAQYSRVWAQQEEIAAAKTQGIIVKTAETMAGVMKDALANALNEAKKTEGKK